MWLRFEKPKLTKKKKKPAYQWEEQQCSPTEVKPERVSWGGIVIHSMTALKGQATSAERGKRFISAGPGLEAKAISGRVT